MKKTRILIVDDDIGISRLLRANLEARGYQALTALNGEEALAVMERELVDLVILDIMMPRLDGLEVCRRLREWTKVPIIVLSARGDEKDKVKCLDLGADDYITKPFGIDELMARVKTALRHSGADTTPVIPPTLVYDDMEINMAARRVTRCGKEVRLTPIEFRLLEELALNHNKVLTHQQLLQRIWGLQYLEETEYLHVFVNRLRRKLAVDGSRCPHIATVPRIGYQFIA